MSRMTDEEIRNIAEKTIREADGGYVFDTAFEYVQAFARAIESAAYERAAQVCDERVRAWKSMEKNNYMDGVLDGTQWCADEIREMKEQK